MNLSYWEYDSFFHHSDLIVVGSGIVGLNAAIAWKEREPKAKVMVLERGSLPSGASTKNAGFACFGSVSELLADQQKNGTDAMLQLFEKRWQGLQKLRTKLGDTNIGYEHFGGYELFRETDENRFETCHEAIPQLNQSLQKITKQAQTFRLANTQNFPFRDIKHLIHHSTEGQIHTGKMMRALLQYAQKLGIEIINGITIKGWQDDGQRVTLQAQNGWQIHTQELIIATNGFTKQLLPELALRPARNQVLITETIPQLGWRGCFHYQEGYVYFRNVGNRILLGGGRHLDEAGETTDQFGFSKQIQSYLLDLLAELVPQQQPKIERWWSGILGVGDRKHPIIQAVSPHVWLAVRLGGMGIAIGSLVGEEVVNQMRDENTRP